MERQSEKLRELLNELIYSISQVEQERLDKALGTFAAYEDSGFSPDDLKQTFTEESCLKLAAGVLGTTPEHLRELIEADKAGLTLIMDEQTALALSAGGYGIDTNKRLRGATHMWDFRGLKGGPKTISYYDASLRLYKIADKVLAQMAGDNDG